jgi:hypothetical protein
MQGERKKGEIRETAIGMDGDSDSGGDGDAGTADTSVRCSS